MTTTQKITFSALFIALGLLLPMAFHMIGAGPVFLPMHIPVLLAGFLAGPGVGMITGLITPALSSVLTGMPPLMPMAVLMTIELGVYGTLAGLFYGNARWSLVTSLIGAMLGGRIIYGILLAYVVPLFGIQGTPILAWITATLGTSWPGILIQLVVVPLVVTAAEKMPLFAHLKVTR
ncbi:MAG: ECF transporter S component [Bacillota bacterium]